MMKNILDIYIYLRKPKAPTSFAKRIAAFNKTALLSNTFQKVQMNSLVFSEGTR